MCSSSTRRDGDSQPLQEGAVKDGSQALAASHCLSHTQFLHRASEPLSRAARAGLAVLGAGTRGLWHGEARRRGKPRGESGC